MSRTPEPVGDLEANASSTPPGSPPTQTISSESVNASPADKIEPDSQLTALNKSSASDAVSESDTNAVSDTSVATLVQNRTGKASAIEMEHPRQTDAGNSGA